MEASEFLETAKRLAESEHEADLRTAISRAYYCAYTSTAWLDSVLSNHGGISQGSGVHQQRSSKFQQYPLINSPDGVEREHSMKVRALGHMLSQLRSLRAKADYELDEIEIGISDVSTAILQCEKILERLNEIRLIFQESYPALLENAS